MYKPLKFMIHLEFLSEDEDVVRCTLIEDDGHTIVKEADESFNAVGDAMDEMFNCGDLGDLFWPLQNEGE